MSSIKKYIEGQRNHKKSKKSSFTLFILVKINIFLMVGSLYFYLEYIQTVFYKAFLS